jgi:hypothetical protein
MTQVSYIVSAAHRYIFDQILNALFEDKVPIGLNIVEVSDPGSGIFPTADTALVARQADPRLPDGVRIYSCTDSTAPGMSIRELTAQSDRVYIQSIHEANAPLYLSLLESAALREPPTFILTDDEVERLYIRQMYLRGGVAEADINRALRHSDALTSAYQRMTRAIVPEPFASVMKALIRSDLEIVPAMLPIMYERQHGAHRDPDTVDRFRDQKINKVSIYTRSISMESWNLDFFAHLARHPSDFDGRAVNIFDSNENSVRIRDRCQSIGAVANNFTNMPIALPLNAYLRFIEDLDALYIQPRSGVLTIRHAVRSLVPIIASKSYERLHFNMGLLQSCGVTTFDSMQELEALLRQGELQSALLRSRANLMLHEANAVKKFTEFLT